MSMMFMTMIHNLEKCAHQGTLPPAERDPDSELFISLVDACNLMSIVPQVYFRDKKINPGYALEKLYQARRHLNYIITTYEGRQAAEIKDNLVAKVKNFLTGYHSTELCDYSKVTMDVVILNENYTFNVSIHGDDKELLRYSCSPDALSVTIEYIHEDLSPISFGEGYYNSLCDILRR